MNLRFAFFGEEEEEEVGLVNPIRSIYVFLVFSSLRVFFCFYCNPGEKISDPEEEKYIFFLFFFVFFVIWILRALLPNSGVG